MMIAKTMLLMTAATYIEGSIVGVTYMDHFDFEERYRDVNECNPFYWHPLHLPAECIEIYEKLIRKNIAALGPVRLVRERYSDEEQYEIHNPVMPSGYSAGIDMYVAKRRLSPLERMIEMMRSDALTIPIAPQIQMSRQFGPVATYRQPISSRSEKVIKEIAGAYRKSMLQSYG